MEAKLTGQSLLYYATLADQPEAVRLILQSESAATINMVVAKPDQLIGQISSTPLMTSMAYGSFGVTKQLLDAKADPKVARAVRPSRPPLAAAAALGP